MHFKYSLDKFSTINKGGLIIKNNNKGGLLICYNLQELSDKLFFSKVFSLLSYLFYVFVRLECLYHIRVELGQLV